MSDEEEPKLLSAPPEAVTTVLVDGVVDSVAEIGTTPRGVRVCVRLSPWQAEHGDAQTSFLSLWKEVAGHGTADPIRGLRLGACGRLRMERARWIEMLGRSTGPLEGLLIEVVDAGPMNHPTLVRREDVADFALGKLVFSEGGYTGHADFGGRRVPVRIEGGGQAVKAASDLARVVRSRWTELLVEVAEAFNEVAADWLDQDTTAAELVPLLGLAVVDFFDEHARLTFDLGDRIEDHDLVAAVDSEGRVESVCLE